MSARPECSEGAPPDRDELRRLASEIADDLGLLTSEDARQEAEVIRALLDENERLREAIEGLRSGAVGNGRHAGYTVSVRRDAYLAALEAIR